MSTNFVVGMERGRFFKRVSRNENKKAGKSYFALINIFSKDTLRDNVESHAGVSTL